MKHFVIDNNVDCYREMLDEVVNKGSVVSPRGLTCIEERNVVITMTKPFDVLAIGCSRKFNAKLAAYEALSLISGLSFPQKAIAIAPNMGNFTNDQGQFDGAYGPRTQKQLEQAIVKLQLDPDTRQACVVLWRSYDLDAETKDLPCTVYLNFAIRNHTLLMTTHMRSQDLWWGWPYDLVQFTQLQHTVANVLGIDVGEYTHIVDSMHVYTRNADDIYKFMHPSHPDKLERPRMQGLRAGNWYQARKWALALMTDEATVLNEITNYSNAAEEFFAAQELWRY